MKQITLDYDLYIEEINEAYKRGFLEAVKDEREELLEFLNSGKKIR